MPLPFERRIMAATWIPSSRSKEGEYGISVTDEVAVPAAVITFTGTGPRALSSGACALICVGLTYDKYAGLPSISTCVPPSDVGKLPFHSAVPPARLVPKIEIHSPAWM